MLWVFFNFLGRSDECSTYPIRKSQKERKNEKSPSRLECHMFRVFLQCRFKYTSRNLFDVFGKGKAYWKEVEQKSILYSRNSSGRVVLLNGGVAKCIAYWVNHRSERVLIFNPSNESQYIYLIYVWKWFFFLVRVVCDSNV